MAFSHMEEKEIVNNHYNILYLLTIIYTIYSKKCIKPSENLAK